MPDTTSGPPAAVSVAPMTPAEAGALLVDEPDWRERFESHCKRWPRLPRYLQEDSAFESTLSDWRHHHSTWTGEGGKQIHPPVSEGVIALAKLGIMPPRHLIKDVPHGGPSGYQCDEHMWLSLKGEQWRITAVEDRMLCLEKNYEDKPETMQIDLTTAKWDKHTEAAIAILTGAK